MFNMLQFKKSDNQWIAYDEEGLIGKGVTQILARRDYYLKKKIKDMDENVRVPEINIGEYLPDISK